MRGALRVSLTCSLSHPQCLRSLNVLKINQDVGKITLRSRLVYQSGGSSAILRSWRKRTWLNLEVHPKMEDIGWFIEVGDDCCELYLRVLHGSLLEQRVWSCYLRVYIKFIQGEHMSNSSLRVIFGIWDSIQASILRVIKGGDIICRIFNEG